MKKVFNTLCVAVILAVFGCNNASLAMEKKSDISQNRIKILLGHIKESHQQGKGQQIVRVPTTNTTLQLNTDWPCLKNFLYDIDPHKVYRDFFDKKGRLYSWKPHTVTFSGGYEFAPYSLRQSSESEKYWDDHNVYILNFNPHSSVVCSNTLEKKKYTSLGQEYDAMALLAGWLLCEEKGFEKIDVLGECRGGATVITALTMISEPYNYESWWKELCVVKNDALDIDRINSVKKMLQKGIIYLGYPLLDIQYFLNNWYNQNSRGGVKDLLERSIKLDLKRPPASVLLKKLVESNEFTMVVDFVRNDHVIGNKHDSLFEGMQNNKFKVIYKSRVHGDRDIMLKEALHVFLAKRENNKDN